VIKFVSDLREVSGFLWVLWFPPPIKVALNNIYQHNNFIVRMSLTRYNKFRARIFLNLKLLYKKLKLNLNKGFCLQIHSTLFFYNWNLLQLKFGITEICYDWNLFESCSWRDVLDTILCDKVCQWLTRGQWFSLGTLVSSTNKTDLHDITEILLKVALNNIYQHNNFLVRMSLLEFS
jgi:hypothetical protein